MGTEKLLASQTIEIFANQPWQRTGLTLTKAEKIKIEYQSGWWFISPTVNNCDGNGAGPLGKPGYTMVGVREGSLIGRVGEQVFYVGNNGETPEGTEGELELCPNDDLEGRYGAGLRDNSGSLTVKLTLWLR